MTLPTFIGIGVPRAGTTWLHEWLAGHPQIYMPTRRKEVRFFDRHYERGLDWYASYFTPNGGSYRALGEISPQYLYCAACPERVAAVLPGVKLLLLLRHPVDRAYSNYGFLVQRKNFRGSFRDFLATRPQALEKGYYGREVTRWLRHFDRAQLLPLLSEETFADVEGAARRVGAFLGVEPERFPPAGGRSVNASTVPNRGGLSALAVKTGRRLRRWQLEPLVDAARRAGVQRMLVKGAPLPKLDREVKHELAERYEHDFEELERALEIDLGVWRR